jgi:hypothetical protein
VPTPTHYPTSLNRLIDAAASGGTGGTYAQEQYQYNNDTGNLVSKAGVTLGYSAQSGTCPAGALSKAHAVTNH